MRRRIFSLLAAVLFAGLTVGFQATTADARSSEDYNGCRETDENPCQRQGTCSIQGSSWYAHAELDRGDTFDTQGWPGLCDMMHVALVQGSCAPLGSRTDVTMELSALSSAFTPEISGSLTCGGDGRGGGGGGRPGGRPTK